MATARRIDKLNILMREVIAELVARLVQFVPGVLVTVTRVEASEDLYSARIFVSVLGGDGTNEEVVMRELERSCGEIQHELNRTLRMRPVPRIKFLLDLNEQRRERIERILADEEGQN